MSMDTKAIPVPLNRITHGLRVSQLIYQYGPGGMVDFPGQTLMTAAPEYWAEQVEKIHDERLEKMLKVDYFGMPSGEAGKKEGVSYVRFPEWYFCPKCRRLKPIQEWVAQYKRSSRYKDSDPYLVRNLQCSDCWQPLVVSRIVTACEYGHIDDFPWIEWAHARSHPAREICANPKLKMMTASSSSEGLEGISVVCECGAKASLTGAFDKDTFKELDEKWRGKYNFTCRGRHPWKHTEEKCSAFPKTMQRGSSSIYFPVTVASLVIPPYSSLLTTKIEESSAFSECRSVIVNLRQMPDIQPDMLLVLVQNQMKRSAEKIAIEIGEDTDAVFETLRRKWGQTDGAEEMSDFLYRSEEYDALNGTTHTHDARYDGDFIREGTNIADYRLPYVKSISLVHKVREVIALTGFTRITPQDSYFEQKGTSNFVPIKNRETNWYPAYQVRGEGIFIEFDEEAINSWRAATPEAKHRVALLNENYARSFIGQKHSRKITEKYLLLHTISHLLIKQLSFECGYGIASLKERIYCSEASDGREMSGIFIYTASGDSEGTLGGLVRQGRHDTFPRIFRKAIEAARICSGDPVCSLSNGQGRDSLNLAACYSCTLIPETSCEDFNAFLDRGVVAGTMKRPEMGFFANQLKDGWHHIKEYSVPDFRKETHSVKRMISTTIIPDLNSALDTSGLAWTMIWENLLKYTDGAGERARVMDFCNKSGLFEGKEYPRQDCNFHISGNLENDLSADLLWSGSHVAVFMSENADSYEQAIETDWKCFIFNDPNFTPEELMKALKEVS